MLVVEQSFGGAVVVSAFRRGVAPEVCATALNRPLMWMLVADGEELVGR